MPQARRGKTASRFQVKIKAGRMNVFAAMREAHGHVCFVRMLVGRKARVAVDAKQRAARSPWITRQMRRDFVQRSGKFGDEPQRRLVRAGVIYLLVREKPLALSLLASERPRNPPWQ